MDGLRGDGSEGRCGGWERTFASTLDMSSNSGQMHSTRNKITAWSTKLKRTPPSHNSAGKEFASIGGGASPAYSRTILASRDLVTSPCFAVSFFCSTRYLMLYFDCAA